MNETLQHGLQSFLTGLRQAFTAGEPEIERKAREAGNVQLVHDLYEALGRGDVPAVAGKMHEEIVIEVLGPPDAPITGRWEGLQPALQAMGRNFALFAEQQPRPEFVVAQGDTVTIIAHETGRYVPTGRRYEVRWLQTFTVRDGKVAHFRESYTGPGPWEQ